MAKTQNLFRLHHFAFLSFLFPLAPLPAAYLPFAVVLGIGRPFGEAAAIILNSTAGSEETPPLPKSVASASASRPCAADKCSELARSRTLTPDQRRRIDRAIQTCQSVPLKIWREIAIDVLNANFQGGDLDFGVRL